ncbi:hypothetical protein [Burkholderia vietnamiensis]|uniref:hypothetical protein n=1 Tax=Burkholderia vietnamiensis TaxID=60552 RepID=UPI001594C7B9|nr:hypothetical protein [Burkholderia vietnamiensis]
MALVNTRLMRDPIQVVVLWNVCHAQASLERDLFVTSREPEKKTGVLAQHSRIVAERI